MLALLTAVPILLLGCIGPALAIPAPLSPEMLRDSSDVIALVRVVAATCTAVFHSSGYIGPLRSYIARLKVLEISKGEAPDEIVIGWTESRPNELGSWFVELRPGDLTRIHLKNRNGAFEPVWWNAATIVHSAGLPLPMREGETRKAPAYLLWTDRLRTVVRRLRPQRAGS